jgi:uncharacterized membrane protein YhaH (DUF805 family)
MLVAVNHGSVNFWIALGAADLVLSAASALVARRARATGRTDRHKRYSQGAWALLALAALCGARIMLLT